MSKYFESKVFPQGQFNCELDDEARLTQSAPEVSNLLQSSYHDQLREQDYIEWSHEREGMQRVTEYLKSEVERLEGALEDAQVQSARHWQIIEDQQLQLDKMRAEKKALLQELCVEKVPKTFIELELEEALEIEKAQSLQLHCELSKLREALQAQEEQAKEEACNAALPETNTLTKEAKVVDRSEHSPRTKSCLFCKGKRSTTEEATAGYIDLIVSEVERQKQKKRELKAALKNAERELEAGWLRWQEGTHAEEELEDHREEAKITDWSEDLQKPCFFCKNKKNTSLAETEEYIAYIVSQLGRQVQKKYKLMAALKKAERENSSLSAQLEDTMDLMADLTIKHEDQTASLVAQLEEQTQRNTNLEAALVEAEWELEAGQLQQQDMALVEEELKARLLQQQDMALVGEELEKLRVETEGLAKAVDQSEQLMRTQPCICKNKKSTTQESTEEHVALILSQLEQEKQKKQEIADALKKAEQENSSLSAQFKARIETNRNLMADLTTKHISQTASLVAQVVEQNQRNATLAAALKKTKQELKVKSYLLQDTEDVNQTLREKEQEWNESESTLKTQLADLQNQIAKKKNKWFRRLFCCTPQH